MFHEKNIFYMANKIREYLQVILKFLMNFRVYFIVILEFNMPHFHGTYSFYDVHINA